MGSQLRSRAESGGRPFESGRPNERKLKQGNEIAGEQSRFVYEAYPFEWVFNWQAHKDLMITASVGRQFHNRFEMTLLDKSRVRISSQPVTRVGAALEWRF